MKLVLFILIKIRITYIIRNTRFGACTDKKKFFTNLFDPYFDCEISISSSVNTPEVQNLLNYILGYIDF